MWELFGQPMKQSHCSLSTCHFPNVITFLFIATRRAIGVSDSGCEHNFALCRGDGAVSAASLLNAASGLRHSRSDSGRKSPKQALGRVRPATLPHYINSAMQSSPQPGPVGPRQQEAPRGARSRSISVPQVRPSATRSMTASEAPKLASADWCVHRVIGYSDRSSPKGPCHGTLLLPCRSL